MKIPKQIRRYCPFCKKHTQQGVNQAKKKGRSALTYGAKQRAKKRGASRGYGGLGRYSKPAISGWKMTGKKSSKKTDLRYSCKECKKMHVQKQGIRAKKVEFK